MNDWPISTIGGVTLQAFQRDPSQQPKSAFRYIDISSIDSVNKEIVATKKMLGSEAPSRARKVVRTGDVLVSTVRPNLNAVALVSEELDGEICSTGFSVLRPSSDLHSGYLFAFVRSTKFINQLVAKTTGANYPAVSERDVRSVSFPLPPLAEQERIVALLDEADALRKLRVRADQRTADLIPALFHDMFGDPATNPMGWPTASFGSLLPEGLRNGVSPSQNGAYSRWVLTLSAITGVAFDASARKLAAFTSDSHVNSVLSERLFLICRGNGNLNLVGRAKYSSAVDTSMMFPDTMIAAMPDEKLITKPFLESVWNSEFVRNQIESGASTTNGTYKINQSLISEVQLPLPPIVCQEDFAIRVKEIEHLRQSQIASTLRVDMLFESLLGHTFAGGE